jgi:glutamate synthase (NADPH/NADH) small chain
MQTRPVTDRIRDYDDVYLPLPLSRIETQASRCMDCGVPFCQAGCPLGNVIPDFTSLAREGDWRGAYKRLASTNNFPEFTGRVCPAPCESACVLGIIEQPVNIEQIERTIAEQAFDQKWVTPAAPARRTGRSVAVVGSGPAGLACAEQLNRAGHNVTVFERDDRVGGLLRYGIPDFKLEKWVVDRRIGLMREAGIRFMTGAHVGVNVPASVLDRFDATVLTAGATRPLDLRIDGRELDGISFAWDYLARQNRLNVGDGIPRNRLDAAERHVVVIGGGDTGSDCVGTANRQGAKSIAQFELLPMPPEERPADQPWPLMPMMLKQTTSHEEGVSREWGLMTTRFIGNGCVEEVETVRVETERDAAGKVRFSEIPGTERRWPADLVLLAIGYSGPETNGLIAELDVRLDGRGNVLTDDKFATSVEAVFAAGDVRRGQSLVVWAISEGREAARAVDAFLQKSSWLPTKGEGDLPRV